MFGADNHGPVCARIKHSLSLDAPLNSQNGARRVDGHAGPLHGQAIAVAPIEKRGARHEECRPEYEAYGLPEAKDHCAGYSHADTAARLWLGGRGLPPDSSCQRGCVAVEADSRAVQGPRH